MSLEEPVEQESTESLPEEQYSPELVSETAFADALLEAVSEGADSIEMTEFTEPSCSGAHGHSPTKGEGSHDVRGAFNVTEEAIRALFPPGVVPNGHDAVHFLTVNKETLVQSDVSLFSDVPNSNEARWSKIHDTAGNAPVPPGRLQRLAI